MSEELMVEEEDSCEGMTVVERNLELARVLSARVVGEEVRRIERVDEVGGFCGWRIYIA